MLTIVIYMSSYVQHKLGGAKDEKHIGDYR